MSHLEAFEDEPCEQCEITTFFVIDGIHVCQNGHEQGTQIIGEDEEDFNIGKLIRKKTEKTSKRYLRTYRGAKAFKLFLQAYQLVIWKQCYTLIHEKGLPGELWTITRDLWSLRLSKLIHRLEEPQTVNSGGQSLTPAKEDGILEEPESNTRAGRSVDSPRLIESIALCYMGILILRFPLALGTLYRWIQDEDVLYIRAIQAVPDDMFQRLPGEYQKALHATHILRPHDLEAAVSDLIIMYHHTFGLTTPRLNYQVLLYRHIQALSLPLEIFPAVERLAEMTQSEFCYAVPKNKPRRKSSAFPERHLISLVVVAVKLFYPLDGVPRRSRTIHEPLAQKLDWTAWQEKQQICSGHHQGINQGKASKIGIRDTEVFSMAPHDLDTYMDWYQKTWIRNKQSQSEDNVNQEILKMFPLHAIGRTTEPTVADREQERDDAVDQRMQPTTATIRLRSPKNDKDASEENLDIKRPGEEFRLFRTEEELPDKAKPFFEAAARVACTSVKDLIRAVLHSESRIIEWKRAKRKEEAGGLDTDIDAESGAASDAEARGKDDYD